MKKVSLILRRNPRALPREISHREISGPAESKAFPGFCPRNIFDISGETSSSEFRINSRGARGMNAFLRFLLRSKPRTLVRGAPLIIALGCVCLPFITTSIVMAEDAASTATALAEDTASTAVAGDAESTVDQLSSELQKSGVVTQEEADAIKSSLKDLVEKGAAKEDLKGIITELSDKGVRGDDLKQSVDTMKYVVNEGEDPKEVGNIVSQAVSIAHAQGLSGKDLAAKAREAILLRKAQKDEENNKGENEIKEEKEKPKTMEGEAQQGSEECQGKGKGQGKGK